MVAEDFKTKLLSLKKQTKRKLSQLRQEYNRRLRTEIFNLFANANALGIPAVCLKESLEKEYYGNEIKVIGNDQFVKQKVSLKVGDRDLSIGDYNSKEDGDLLDFVVEKYTTKSKKT